MSIAPALSSAFRTMRRPMFYPSMPHVERPRISARMALAHSRVNVERGHAPPAPRADTIGHGDVIRSRAVSGERRTYVVAIVPDSQMGNPWDEHDTHGAVREYGTDKHGLGYAAGSNSAKAPGEVLFSSGERHANLYAYNVESTVKRARADGWILSEAHARDLERRLGRTPTARETAAECVRRDLEHCRAYLCDRWGWIGVCLIEMPRDEEHDPRTVADEWAAQHRNHMPGTLRASLWGIESDSPAYHHTVALDLVREADAS